MKKETTSKAPYSLQNELIKELEKFSIEQNNKFPEKETIKIDLHCHDYNSNVPDELLGRMLNVPETWLDSEKLFEILKENGAKSYTITNHNNARSCYEMIDKGYDVLVGAEFSCMVPDFNIGIHVLAYGFSYEQEISLLKLRKNLYSFLEYACQQNIPTIWAHPLYHYASNQVPSIDFFEKMSLLFERFEILNGQRDTWQNMLMKIWIEELSPEKIDCLATKYRIDPNIYCRNPYRKAMSGGSDSHIGLFAGQTGTYLHVPDLKKKLKEHNISDLALEAIRECRMAPYGSHSNSEKLTIALLDYVCQIALNRKDPGLLRILLHKGTTNDKILALIISNAFSELQHHKVTMKFIELFHESFMGKQPKFMKRWFVPKAYKTVFDDAVQIALTKKKDSGKMVESYQTAINSISASLNAVLFNRIKKKIKDLLDDGGIKKIDFNNIINQFEFPSEIRALLGNEESNFRKSKRIINPNIPELLDGLSFPFLATGLILAAHYASAKVLFNNRELLNQFSKQLNRFEHPKRMLWLTDTYNDKNGVSMVLQSMHEEIKKRNLPIDILVCSNNVKPDDNLIVVKPLLDINLPMYNNQALRIPNFLEIHNLFQANEYDRIMCSTEGFMGLAGLYLKNAFSVEANFYIHTDWISYGKTTLNIERANLNRFRRMLRAYYQSFDQLFVLNSDQEKWLTGREMNIPSERVHTTAHWVEAFFKPTTSMKGEIFGLSDDEPVMLFAGRLSAEKGVIELINIYKEAAEEIEDLKLVIVGSGPEEKELKKRLPDAIYLGWVEHSALPGIYSSADLLVLPSQFDTFSCVVLEAHSCGLPVIAYNTKGPKDIIIDNSTGYLVNSIIEFTEKTIAYFKNKKSQKTFKSNALKRSKEYNASIIIEKLLVDVKLKNE
ncbi:MAG: glycosyltransferase [Bacteroidota bacterium]